MLELQAKLLLDTAKLLFHLIDPLLSNIAVEERAGGEGGVGMGVVVGVVEVVVVVVVVVEETGKEVVVL